MGETTQQVIVAVAALGALAFIGRRAIALFRPSSTSSACEHCALPLIVDGAGSPQASRERTPADER